MNTSKSKRILVVDDEIHLREIVVFDLEEAGFVVEQANSGKAAIASIKSNAYDLVISDVRMPQGSGVELLSWVKELNPLEPSFIFMTAFADISSDEALHLGAEAFLNKPIDMERMMESVGEAIVSRLDRWKVPMSDIGGLRKLQVGVESSLLGDSVPRIVLGGGGLFFEMEDNFPSSLEIVQFELEHEGMMLKGEGRVRWVRHEPTARFSSGIGLEFLYLSDDCRSNFLQYLQANRPQAYIPLGGIEK